jgi:hypothetical protein
VAHQERGQASAFDVASCSGNRARILQNLLQRIPVNVLTTKDRSLAGLTSQYLQTYLCPPFHRCIHPSPPPKWHIGKKINPLADLLPFGEVFLRVSQFSTAFLTSHVSAALYKRARTSAGNRFFASADGAESTLYSQLILFTKKYNVIIGY